MGNPGCMPWNSIPVIIWQLSANIIITIYIGVKTVSFLIDVHCNIPLIDCDKIFGETCWRNRRDGDSFVPINRKCTKTLKRLFNDEKISLNKRSQMLILSDEKGIVWTEFFGVADRCKVANKTKNMINIKKVGD